MFRGLGVITSYSFQFNGATGVITGSDGYTFDCNSKIPQILADSTYKANDLVYGMTEDWLHKHASQCRNVAENSWNWECIKNQVVAPNVLSDAYLPMYPAIDAWIIGKRGSVTQPPASGGGSTTPPTGGSPGGSPFPSGSGGSLPPGGTVCAGTFICSIPDMWLYIGAGVLALMMMKR